MAEQIQREQFVEALLMALEETFEKVRGMYLDRGTSLFETLATISAEEASRPVSATCASIAAHVAHLTLYMDVTSKFVRGEQIEVDWSEIWRTVQAVTPEEWEASQQELRSAYGNMQALARDTAAWGTNEIGGALALLMHNAYHLGEIRQALCTLRN